VVNYDQNSFLSGIAVGRQLKGWSTAEQRVQRSALAAASLAGVTVIASRLSAVPALFGGEPDVYGILHFGTLAEINVSVAVSPGAIPAAPGAAATLAGVPAANETVTGLPARITGEIGANAILEVEE